MDKWTADENMVIADRVCQLHESPYRVVLAITGGGSEVVGELLRHGNGSATVLDAVIPYSTNAMDRFLGRKPDKYCSEKTARAMAMVAYQRALELSKDSDGLVYPNVIGIGATCKLKATNERKGRKHEIYVAIQTFRKTGVNTLELTLDRTRQEEEKIVASLIFNVLARYCDVTEINFPEGIQLGEIEDVLEKYSSVSEHIGDVLKQQNYSQNNPYEIMGIARINFNESEPPKEIRLVFPGSFDPCHKNHVFMARWASERYNKPVHFEISLKNVDKPPIDFISLSQRLDSLRKYKDEDFMGDVYLTNAPMFIQKVTLFPYTTFIVGADTINRIFDEKYYLGVTDMPSVLEHFKEQNVRFMVFHRKSVELTIDPELLEVCEIVSLDEYKDDGISSTKIRNNEV